MNRNTNEHFEIWGTDLGMPLIEDCGYNGWHIAEHLSWHAHEGFELVWLMDGQAAFEFMDGGRCELAGEDFFFKLPRQIHRAADEVTSPCKMCWIVFNPMTSSACDKTTFTQADLDYLRERYLHDERQIFSVSPSFKPLLESFCQMIKRLHSYYREGNRPLEENHGANIGRSNSFAEAAPPQVALLRSYICQILLETAHQAMAGRPKKADEFVAAAISFLENNYRDDTGVDQIADHLGLSRTYLHTVFRDGTGQTPNDYLQRTRIKAAENLLGKTSTSITEIASTVGFSSSQYFSKVFHKYTRQTPQAYRKARQRLLSASS